MKLSALGLNVDFSTLNFSLLASRSAPYGAVKFGYPLKCAISATSERAIIVQTVQKNSPCEQMCTKFCYIRQAYSDLLTYT